MGNEIIAIANNSAMMTDSALLWSRERNELKEVIGYREL
jgi:hypothetical protein